MYILTNNEAKARICFWWLFIFCLSISFRFSYLRQNASLFSSKLLLWLIDLCILQIGIWFLQFLLSLGVSYSKTNLSRFRSTTRTLLKFSAVEAQFPLLQVTVAALVATCWVHLWWNLFSTYTVKNSGRLSKFPPPSPFCHPHNRIYTLLMWF